MVSLKRVSVFEASGIAKEALTKGFTLYVKGLPWSKSKEGEKIVDIRKITMDKKNRPYIILDGSVVLEFNLAVSRILVQDIYGKFYPLFHRSIKDEDYTVNWFQLNEMDFIAIPLDYAGEGNFILDTDTATNIGIIRDIFIDTIDHVVDITYAPDNKRIPMAKNLFYSILP